MLKYVHKYQNLVILIQQHYYAKVQILINNLVVAIYEILNLFLTNLVVHL